MKRNLFSELKEGMDALRAEREARGAAPTRKDNPHIGSRFDDFLKAEGRLDEATAVAHERIKRLKP
jgi:hypothetical protein